MLATGERRQRLGDMAGHTSVVDAKASGQAADAFDIAPMQAQPAGARAAEPAKAKSSRPKPGWAGAEAAVVRPLEGAQGAEAGGGVRAGGGAQAGKGKKGRPSLGGPELKLPSFGRSKAPKAPKAAKPREARRRAARAWVVPS